MVQDRGTGSDSTSVSLTKSEFLKSWSSLKKSSVIVVGTTNYPEVIGYAFLRRLGTLLYIGPPDEAARLSLIASTLAEAPHSVDSEAQKALAELYTQGLTCDEIVTGIDVVRTHLVDESMHEGDSIMVPGTDVYERCRRSAWVDPRVL
ncbi:MAG: hypothetical protein Q9184_003747 [Pyrenodesmia sp. 2 TL-2023]